MLALIIIALILFSFRRPLFGGWIFWPFGGWWGGWHRPPMVGPDGMGHGPGGMGGPMGSGPHS
jgi:hypothetical protein